LTKVGQVGVGVAEAVERHANVAAIVVCATRIVAHLAAVHAARARTQVGGVHEGNAVAGALIRVALSGRSRHRLADVGLIQVGDTGVVGTGIRACLARLGASRRREAGQVAGALPGAANGRLLGPVRDGHVGHDTHGVEVDLRASAKVVERRQAQVGGVAVTAPVTREHRHRHATSLLLLELVEVVVQAGELTARILRGKVVLVVAAVFVVEQGTVAVDVRASVAVARVQLAGVVATDTEFRVVVVVVNVSDVLVTPAGARVRAALAHLHRVDIVDVVAAAHVLHHLCVHVPGADVVLVQIV
jgi:hypothetical protein